MPVAQAPARGADEEAAPEAAAAADVSGLIAAMDWRIPGTSPHVRGLTTALRELRRLDADYRPERLVAYAELAHSIARLDLERAAAFEDSPTLAEQAVVVLALSGPMLELLRRMAQEDQVRRRTTFEDADASA